MKTLAIIAEYNPFHNGHLYHLTQAKKLTGADYVIVLMGGNFLQRGYAAMWDKYVRAEMALSQGIDLVIELPFVYATGSAHDFAGGAIRILNALNHVDFLCFGAETPEKSLLFEIADLLVKKPEELEHIVADLVATGCSYPSAQAKALEKYTNNPAYAKILSSPNNTLAIEYLCALIRTRSSIKPVCIERKNSYHDENLTGTVSTATAIRKLISESCDRDLLFSLLKKEVPQEIFSCISEHYQKKSPVYPDDISPFLQEKRIFMKKYPAICDLNEALEHKLYPLPFPLTFSETVEKMKSKNVTSARLSRALIHLLFQYTEEDRRLFSDCGYAFYANILGLKKSSSHVIREIENASAIPLITKKADFESILASSQIPIEPAKRMWEYDRKATELYNCMIFNRYGCQNANDFTVKLPVR